MSYAGTQNGNGYGTYANRPAQGQKGRTYYATDTAVFYYDDGTAWRNVGPGWTLTPPVVADFSWVNQGGASATDSASGLQFNTLGTNSGSRSARLLVKTAPSTPYTITAQFLYTGATIGSTVNGPVGLCFRQSSDGKIHCLTIDHNNNGDMVIKSTKYTNATTFSADYSSVANNHVLNAWWFKISDNGTNRFCEYSFDGITYTNFHFVGRTDFLTADQVGLFVDPLNQDIKVLFTAWRQS